MAHEYTASEMADLTPSERDALVTAQDTDNDDIAALANEADAGAAPNAGDAGTPTEQPTEKPAPTAEEVAAAAALAAAADATQEQKDAAIAVANAYEAAQEAEKIKPTKGIPEYDRESRDDATATREAVLKTKEEAFKKLLDGEIEPDEYQKIERETMAQLEALTAAALTDKITDKIAQAQLRVAWDAETEGSMARLTEAGVTLDTEARMVEFDRLIKVFGQEAQQSGMSDAGLVASKWALKEAEKIMISRYGKAPAKVVPTVAAPANAAPKNAGNGATERPTLQTLGGLPAAARNETGDDMLDKLGTLQGEDLEMAVARMSPSDVHALLHRVH